MTQRDSETLVDLGAIWDVFFAGRRLVAVLALVGLVAAGYQAFVRSEPKYRATAVLVLETQMHKINGIQSIVSDLPLGGFSTDPVLFTELEVFKSRFLIRDVVSELNLTELPEFSQTQETPRFIQRFAPWWETNSQIVDPAEQKRRAVEAAIDQVLEQVEVKLVPNSFAFHVTANSKSPQLAQELANTVANLYVQSQLATKTDATRQATHWLSARVAELKVELDQAQTRLKLFSANTDLLTKDDLFAREIQLKEMRARVKLIETQRAELEFAHTRGLDSVPTDPVELVKPLTTDAKAISLVQEDAISGRENALPNDLRRANAQISALNFAIQKASNQITEQAADLLELEQIEREVDASKTLYEFFLSRLKETTIQQGIQRADSRILSPAVLPIAPASPNRPAMLMVGALLGVLLGTVLVFLRDGSRRNFKNLRELAGATDTSVAGAVAYTMHEMADDAAAHALNAMRGIRTTLMENQTSPPPQTVMMVSSNAQEGARQMATLFAQVTGQINQSVLYLDADMRAESWAAQRALDAPTVSEIIQDTNKLEQAISTQQNPAYDILSLQVYQSDPADIMASPAFANLMAALKKRYGLVVVNAPAVLLYPDARILAKHCDAILYCVRANHTPKNQLVQGIETFQSIGALVRGVLLTHCLDRTSVFGSSSYTPQYPGVVAMAN